MGRGTHVGWLPGLVVSLAVAQLGAVACGQASSSEPGAGAVEPADAATDSGATLEGGAIDGGIAPDATPWKVTPTATFSGQYSAVGDPSVVRAAPGVYRMYHHCLDVERAPQGAEICLAESADGVTWSAAATAESTALVHGRLLRATSGTWHEAHETPFAHVKGGVTSLFLIGYQGSSFFGGGASLGQVTSADGLVFSAIGGPILSPTPSSSDAFGFTSPSVVQRDDGSLVLYSTGWCVAPLDCPRGSDAARLTLLAATSADGVAWTKRPTAVVADPKLAWTNGGVSEAEVVRAPDGRYVLFFSSLAGAAGSAYEFQRIGVAVATDPFGPFTFAADAAVTPAMLGSWANGGVLAPSVLFEGNRVRMWFHGFERDGSGKTIAARIGYAENAWPLGL